MRSTFFRLFLLVAGVKAIVFLGPHRAEAKDTYLFTLQPGADAGTTAVNADAGINGRQLMMRCESYAVTAKFCEKTATSCTATGNDTAIDSDKSLDLCPTVDDKYLSVFRTYDGGVPSCRVYAVNPKTICPP